ncbi:hypothetical protein LTR60_005099, partial [Cryomyces antarcticus]
MAVLALSRTATELVQNHRDGQKGEDKDKDKDKDKDMDMVPLLSLHIKLVLYTRDVETAL